MDWIEASFTIHFLIRNCVPFSLSFSLMKKKQKIKANPIASGRFAGQPHLGGYLSCGSV